MLHIKLSNLVFFKNYVGFVQFFFKHTLVNQTCFPVFLELPKSHKPSRYNNYIPMIELHNDNNAPRKYMVISLDDIVGQVELIVAPKLQNYYNIILAYMLDVWLIFSFHFIALYFFFTIINYNKVFF